MYIAAYLSPRQFLRSLARTTRPTYRYRAVHILDVALLDQNLSCLETQLFDLSLANRFASFQLFDLSARKHHVSDLFWTVRRG